MATDAATESLPDSLASLPRVDVVAAELRMSVDVLLGKLRAQGIYLNPGDRAPRAVVLEAMQAELDAGRPWRVERIEWPTG
jgi:hypothetical protein